MRKIRLDLGVDGTTLIIRDKKGDESVRYKGAELKKIVQLLEQVQDLGLVSERRGLPFAKLLSLRGQNGALPLFHVILDDQEHFFYNVEDYEAFVETNKVDEIQAVARAVESADAATNGDTLSKAERAKKAEEKRKAQLRLEKNEELHENRELERIFEKLKSLDLPIEDYLLKVEETDSGDRKMTRYLIINGEDYRRDVAGLADIVPVIHEIAQQGIEVKRFKGLGEMNADELWATTMDPARRTLLRVTLEGASNAEAMFSTLMGEDVERRRRYIEEHALDVKNLDV